MAAGALSVKMMALLVMTLIQLKKTVVNGYKEKKKRGNFTEMRF